MVPNNAILTDMRKQKVFDYTSLDAGVSLYVRQRTGEIRALMKRTAQDIIEIGQKLVAVKEKLAHGRFLDWIEAEFEWSYPTAARFIQVANSFSKDYQIDKFAPSALYLLAAPSTPETARAEALTLAEAGEQITYTRAKAIKQKHSRLPEKSAPGPVPQPQLMPELVQNPPAANVEIVTVLSQGQVPTSERSAAQSPQVFEEENSCESLHVVKKLYISPLPQPVYLPEQPTACWQLGTRHLLYCQNPDSPGLLQKLPEKVSLLLAFPPSLDWQSEIRAENRIIATQHLPQGKDVRLFEDTLESIILLFSKLGDELIICFLPSPEILSIVNRLDRRGIFIEPDAKRAHEIISDWRASGLKAERMSV